ncbi:MAG: hypothetical protein A3F35_00440 [Candidatus Woykebacteria bacterium RIFCSPHIGHO2_12_FULL_45_10]|uniref:Carbohydrate kinase PfkB domain-containing protein n=1 Tax=Candidatus Woykebacteria bacterium RIFCSPHIGHO2_12_FULL_45_10 TaxID=1802603 RepID=A0A1G1WQA9_9BACT|nr:MAG: hypothetical protein A3F35_00440 [Candidatus Woykebacteria bacterium RIFCSPHIGHO2_12_FULL_45_10]
MYDLIAVGDATIDTFIKIHDAHVQCNVNKEDCQLCVNYADKIAVDSISHLVAGNAANNAVGSARLGMNSAIYVNIGEDDSGEKIKNQLEKEGVDSRYVIVNKGMDSNYSAVLNFEGERTIFVYHQHWNYRLPALEPAKWVYLTSLSKSFAESTLVADLVVYLKETGAKLSYNPGTYQMEVGVKNDPELLKLTELLFVNVEEAKRILGIAESTHIEIKALLKKTISDLEVRNAVITDGREGSYAFDRKNYWRIKEFPGERLEATGAGDAYATACQAAIFYGHSLAEGMAWGAINASYKVKKVGPQAGLLRKDEMEKVLSENPSFKAERF